MNANRLKLLMMGLMVLDHISYFVPPEWTLIFHVITRCVGVFWLHGCRRFQLYTECLSLQWSFVYLGSNHVCWKYAAKSFSE